MRASFGKLDRTKQLARPPGTILDVLPGLNGAVAIAGISKEVWHANLSRRAVARRLPRDGGRSTPAAAVRPFRRRRRIRLGLHWKPAVVPCAAFGPSGRSCQRE